MERGEVFLLRLGNEVSLKHTGTLPIVGRQPPPRSFHQLTGYRLSIVEE